MWVCGVLVGFGGGCGVGVVEDYFENDTCIYR